jgi:hypothetical protein
MVLCNLTVLILASFLTNIFNMLQNHAAACQVVVYAFDIAFIDANKAIGDSSINAKLPKVPRL